MDLARRLGRADADCPLRDPQNLREESCNLKTQINLIQESAGFSIPPFSFDAGNGFTREGFIICHSEEAKPMWESVFFYFYLISQR